jgi:hypothetical protein
MEDFNKNDFNEEIEERAELDLYPHSGVSGDKALTLAMALMKKIKVYTEVINWIRYMEDEEFDKVTVLDRLLFCQSGMIEEANSLLDKSEEK